MLWRQFLAGKFKKGRRIFFVAGERPADVVEQPNYHFAEFGESDFKQSSLVQTRDRPKVFSIRLSWGHRCYGWRHHDGQIASYLWFSDSNALNTPWMFDVNLMMRPGCAYIWDCRTAPEHASRGLYTAGLARLQRLAAKQGATSALIDCAPDNAPSIRAIEKAGFRRVSDVELRQIGPLHLLRINSKKWRTVSECLDPHWLES